MLWMKVWQSEGGGEPQTASDMRQRMKNLRAGLRRRRAARTPHEGQSALLQRVMEASLKHKLSRTQSLRSRGCQKARRM